MIHNDGRNRLNREIIKIVFLCEFVKLIIKILFGWKYFKQPLEFVLYLHSYKSVTFLINKDKAQKVSNPLFYLILKYDNKLYKF